MTTKVELKLYVGIKNINKAMAANATVGASWQAETHRLACSVLAHVGKHKDVRVVDAFIKSMPDSSRVNSLRKWFVEFGPIAFGDEAKVSYVPNKATQIGDAMAKPFWSFKAVEGEYVPLDLDKMTKHMIGKLEKDALKTKRDHSALITALKMSAVVSAVVPTATPASEGVNTNLVGMLQEDGHEFLRKHMIGRLEKDALKTKRDHYSGRIAAIKALRGAYPGYSLSSAKQIVDKYIEGVH